ncbi:hypothetical protein CcCBS67573_g10573 [Chytriomyces confervae]|uniref:TFA2 Winged helix domain-containing protein n=1 Tax=Chytriomyces confervae TaxID=246404 RepID=A0A507CQR4_9FUNG|nr:hypothetical protein CcCBS67573_g10573 [Chytriomyces confervae]
MSGSNKARMQVLLTSMLSHLKATEGQVKFSDVSAKLNTDILSSADFIKLWKDCAKICYDEKAETMWYKHDFAIRSKTELLDLLKANVQVGGLDVKAVKAGYSGVIDAIKELEAEGQILVLRTKDGTPKTVYFNSLQDAVPRKYPSSTEFKAYWDKVTVPNDDEVSRVLAQAGLSVTEMASGKPTATKTKTKGKSRGRKAKITNTHLEGVDLSLTFK